MARYIDADKIDWRLIIPTNISTAEEHMLYKAQSLIERQQTADVVKVVRCKDCKHYVKACFEWHDDDFCSYGERRTE